MSQVPDSVQVTLSHQPTRGTLVFVALSLLLSSLDCCLRCSAHDGFRSGENNKSRKNTKNTKSTEREEQNSGTVSGTVGSGVVGVGVGTTAGSDGDGARVGGKVIWFPLIEARGKTTRGIKGLMLCCTPVRFPPSSGPNSCRLRESPEGK